MIPLSAWLVAPVLTYFWIYRGMPFWKSVLLSLMVHVVLRAFIAGGIVLGILVILIFVNALFVYFDAEGHGFSYEWLYALMVFIFPLFGFGIYLLIRMALLRKQSLVVTNGPVQEITFLQE